MPVKIAGATTLHPVIEDIAKDFSTEHPGIRVDVLARGTGSGINAVLRGSADIAMMAREPTSDEAEQLVIDWIATDGIAIVVHRDTQMDSDIDYQTLRALYTAENGGAFTRIRKQASHGTATALAKWLDLHPSDVQAELEGGSNAEVLALVSHTPGSIGYVSHIDAERSIKAGDAIRILSVNGILPNQTTIASGTYPILRRLGLAMAKDDPQGARNLARSFIAFVRSAPEARRALRQQGLARF